MSIIIIYFYIQRDCITEENLGLVYTITDYDTRTQCANSFKSHPVYRYFKQLWKVFSVSVFYDFLTP